MENNLSIRIKNDLSELGRVNQIIEKFNRSHPLPLKVLNAINLALDDIITNIVSYAYDDQSDHDIDIRISLTEGQLILQIEDDGRPFNPLELPEADTESSLEQRAIGGLGVHLVRNVMDEIDYTYKNRKNHLIMKKKIKET